MIYTPHGVIVTHEFKSIQKLPKIYFCPLFTNEKSLKMLVFPVFSRTFCFFCVV